MRGISQAKGGVMKRALLLLILLGVGVTTPASAQDLINGALTALGGADALMQVKTLVVKGTVRYWEPEQSMVAGGEPRHVADATFETTGDFMAHMVRVDWVKNFLYPAPRTFQFSEIVTPEAGYVIGIDSNGRNKQNRETNPPGHAMSGLRFTATQRELRRASPSLLLEMRSHPDKVSASPAITIGSVSYPVLTYQAGPYTFIVMFDPQTHLPARIRTLDYDNIWGDATYDLTFADWRKLGGAQIATSQHYELNGQVVAEIKITDVSANTPLPADRFEVPAALQGTAPKPASGNVPYQWVLRRQFIGIYLDSDNPSFDTRATDGLRLVEVAPGVQHAVGGSHNSLIVELGDALVVFDAPVSDWQTNWTIAAAQAKYPGKPIKYLVLTHHHMDHAGGLRAYAAAGATLVVGKGNADHFRKVLTMPFTRNLDLAPRDLSKTAIVEVAEQYTIPDGKRQVTAYLAENPHANGMLIGYVADAQLGFVTDLWSPGAAPLPDKINPALAAVVNTVKKAGITPLKFAGGHGATGDYAPLAALAGN
jgi:glyoxylase-like metal-dependent hydrolase (beta-lactamase superfamily II)